MWDSDASKEKSRKAQKNRLIESDGPRMDIVKHMGGSRCAQQHAAALAKEKGVPADQIGWKVFMRLHCSDGVFSDPKSTRIVSEVCARAEELSQPLPGTTEPREVDMTSIYLDVVGVSEKKRVFGLGYRSHAYSSSDEGSSIHSAATSQLYTDVVITQRVAEM